MHSGTRTVALLLFGSGMAALVYQTAWQRMLRLVFGASTAASAAVIAIFLGGLGVGGIWLGKRVERSPRPLEFYGTLEAGVSVCAAISPVLVLLAEMIYFGSGGSARLGIVGATALRVALALLIMGPAVVLMGGTLPAAARSVESATDRARAHLAFLYAANTAGAVVGALLGTFLLFELFGTRLTLWIAALLNLLVALLARSIGRASDPVPVTETEAHAGATDVKAAPVFTAHSSYVYGMAAMVGFAFVALELVWYRMLGPVLGGSSFMFGLILAVALAGIGVGGYLYSRRSEGKPVSLNLLASTLALEALCVAIPLALGDRIAFFAAYTRPMAAMGFSALVLSWTLISVAVVFPASVVAGYQFPVLFALLGQGRERVARQVGLAYAFNTFGSIVGALLVGFVMIPQLGAVASWRAMVVLLAVLFALTIVFEVGKTRARPAAASVLALGAAALALVCLSAEGPTAAWRHSAIGAGRAEIDELDRNGLRGWQLAQSATLLWEKDGVESSVALEIREGVAFIVNGKSDGAVISDRGTQGGFGLLLSLLHPNPKDAFVLGLGTGMTAGWVAAVPGMKRVDVAELEPAIVEVARLSAAVNERALERDNVHVHLGDGREFLLTGTHKYDIIASEPSNPYRAGIASLFTQEFYENVAARLNPGGLFGQWLQGYEVDAQTIRSVLRTLRQVFPHVEMWHTQAGDLMLVAALTPPQKDVNRMRERVRRAPYLDGLPRLWLVEDIEGVFSHFIANSQLTEALSQANAPELNTDDNSSLEYAFARNVGIGGPSWSEDLLQLSGRQGTDRPSVQGEVDWKRVLELRPRAWLINLGSPPQVTLQRASLDRQTAVVLGCRGQYKAAADWFRKQPDATRDIVEQFVVASGLAREKDPATLPQAQALQARGFSLEADAIRARYHFESGNAAEAVASALRALAAMRSTGLPLCSAGSELIAFLPALAQRAPNARRTLVDALAARPFAAYVYESVRQSTLRALGSDVRDPGLCLRALGRSVDHPVWDQKSLLVRYNCLQAAGDPRAPGAARDVEEFLTNTSGNISAGVAR